MLSIEWRRAFFWAVLFWALSWGAVRLGISLGENLPKGEGYPAPGQISEDLFRFDSTYYLDIAEHGYSYSGDPNSNPNLVFAPLFPLLVSAIPGVDTVTAGFVLNKIFLLLSLVLLFAYLRQEFGQRHAVVMTLALVTAAGSYAFHAFYAESTMLFCLSSALLSWQRRWWFTLALAAAFLGASRLAALPLLFAFAAVLSLQAHRLKRPGLYAYAAICFSGAAAYLLYIGLNFGEPFTLLDQIQKASWGRFHPDVDWIRLVSGAPILEYIGEAAQRGLATIADIKTLNLAWMLLALASCVHLLKCYRRHPFTFVFLPYCAFIYYATAGSDFLISSHRFFVLMLPIFLMMADLHAWLARKIPVLLAHGVAALLILINLGYGLLHTAFFNQGIWFWF